MKPFASVRCNAGDSGGGAENLGIVSQMREGMSDQPMEDGEMEGSDRKAGRKEGRRAKGEDILREEGRR